MNLILIMETFNFFRCKIAQGASDESAASSTPVADVFPLMYDAGDTNNVEVTE